MQGVQASGMTSKAEEAVRDCLRQAASQLQSPGEALGFCCQAEAILEHAKQCQSAEEQMRASTAVSAMLVKLQAMDQRVAANLQLAEHWCYLAGSVRLSPPWEESEAVMELCLNMQKARSGVSPISSTLLDQVSQCIENLTVGSDLYVSSQRKQVKQGIAEAVQLRAKIVRQVPELTGQLASVLLASCNESSRPGQMLSPEQQRAQQLLAAGCAQQSLPQHAILACTAWVSQIQCHDSKSITMLTDLLSAAELLSRTAERYGVASAPPPAPEQVLGMPVHSNSTSTLPMHAPGSIAMIQPVASTPYAAGNQMSSQPRTQMPACASGQNEMHPSRMTASHSVHPTQIAASPTPPVHVATAPQLRSMPQPEPSQQPPAPVHSNALVASLLQASQGHGGVQQGAAGSAGPVARAMPSVSAPVTGTIVGVPVAQQPQPNNSVSGSDPLLAMWNDLQS